MKNQPARNAHRFSKYRPLLPDDDWVDPLLGEWTSWLKAARRSPDTIRVRAPIVQKFAEDVCVNPVSATSHDIIEWFERNPQWSAATARVYWSALAAWFKWLNRQQHRVDNPMLLLDAPARPEHEPRPVSDADMRRLLVTPMHNRTRTMILLAALAGLRVSEVSRVRGEDVDLAGRLLYVRGKGGMVKTVPMHPMLVTEAAKMPAKGWWFPSREKPGAPVQGRTVSFTISQVMKRAGVRATPHALRHWFGTNALRVSGDLRAVQMLMRHQSVRSTQIYTEVADDTRAGVVDKLDPFGDAREFLEEN